MAWDLGDTIPLTTEITDAAGDLTPAAGVVCTIGLPDGTTATPVVSTPSTGRYQADYVSVQVGRHTERWTSVAPATARSDVFDVRPAAPDYLISLGDARAHLNYLDPTDRVDDEELRDMIATATSLVEDLSGEATIRRTVVEVRHLPRPTDVLAFGTVPVLSLTSIVDEDGRVRDLTYVTVSAAGVAKVRAGWWFEGRLTLTYTAGHQVIPNRFTTAAKMALSHLWSTQRGIRGAPRLGRDSTAAVVAGATMADVRAVLGNPAPGIA